MSKYIENPFDYEAVHAQAGYVIQNRKHLKRSAVERYKKVYDEKCRLSKEEAERAKACIPGGIQHNLANNYPFSIAMDRAEGPYLYDIDGNRYIDFLCAGGPIILGNNYPAVRDATVDMLREKGPVTGLYSVKEREFSELICKYYPSVEMVRMMGSGTEADIIAIRLARAYTGKKHIIRILGGYHGWSDQLVYNGGTAAEDNGMCRGIPGDCYQYTHAVPVNDLEILEHEILKHQKDGGAAAFIMEAVGQDSGIVPTTIEYHREAEKLCRKYGMLLVYDEVVTGFRLGMGGAQAIYGTKPDITVFGKIIGGGLPAAGALGGRREIMDLLAAGINAAAEKKVKVGGTLSANHLTACAGLAAIRALEAEQVHEKLSGAADYFMREISAMTEKYEIPAILFNHQSILHIDLGGLQHIPYFYKDGPKMKAQVMDAYMNMVELSMALAAEGLIVAVGGKTYLSLDTTKVLDDALEIYDKVLGQYE
ncbi:MAG: aminotransferase class III-fold pyridoxal phosphate-dependent enzyme [Lachnospiraceae bacterium]|jgi:glutamate-1-semialdehyde 2,1-aminomutase|nr:aminotransferase class III-fold pyridoxal phosphate-dependent enzyme [Lachnospiraceae bacterium]